jgi:hypothetical protein
MAGEPTDGLMREIDEALRQEKLQHFFRLCGRYIIVVSAVILLSTGSYVWWKSHVRTTHERLTEQLHNAISLVENGKSYQARSIFDQLAQQSDDHIALLAGLWKVKLKHLAGKTQEAKEIATTLEKKYGKRSEFFPYTDWLKLHETTSPMNGTYALSAQELQAITHIHAKEFDKASLLLEQMLKLEHMPHTMRDRVKKLLAYSKRHLPTQKEGNS